MSNGPHIHAHPRARPVAEAPIDALLARVEDLAKRWAIELILARPIDRIGEIPLEDLAREAPALCAHVVRALGSDTELERMAGGGGGEDAGPASRLGALAGAQDPGSTVEAVEALRGVLWEALLNELRWPIFDRSPARLVADLADRLAYVCSMALAVLAHDTVAAIQDADVVAAGPGDRPAPDPDRGTTARRPAVVVDEQDDVPTPPYSTRPPEDRSGASPSQTVVKDTAAEGGGRTPEAQQTEARPLPWDTPPPEEPRARQATPQIEIRDERGEEGPAAWIGSIGRQLERYGQDGLPFAVLLVELVDIERLRRAEPLGEMSRLTSRVEGALAEELQPIGDRPAGSLTRESPGRYWILAPETDGAGARTLAERLACAVRVSASHSGAPLEVAVGVAVCPEDGREASALASYADVGLYAARAEGRSSIGRPIASVDDPA